MVHSTIITTTNTSTSTPLSTTPLPSISSLLNDFNSLKSNLLFFQSKSKHPTTTTTTTEKSSKSHPATTLHCTVVEKEEEEEEEEEEDHENIYSNTNKSKKRRLEEEKTTLVDFLPQAYSLTLTWLNKLDQLINLLEPNQETLLKTTLFKESVKSNEKGLFLATSTSRPMSMSFISSFDFLLHWWLQSFFMKHSKQHRSSLSTLSYLNKTNANHNKRQKTDTGISTDSWVDLPSQVLETPHIQSSGLENTSSNHGLPLNTPLSDSTPCTMNQKDSQPFSSSASQLENTHPITPLESDLPSSSCPSSRLPPIFQPHYWQLILRLYTSLLHLTPSSSPHSVIAPHILVTAFYHALRTLIHSLIDVLPPALVPWPSSLVSFFQDHWLPTLNQFCATFAWDQLLHLYFQNHWVSSSSSSMSSWKVDVSQWCALLHLIIMHLDGSLSPWIHFLHPCLHVLLHTWYHYAMAKTTLLSVTKKSTSSHLNPWNVLAWTYHYRDVLFVASTPSSRPSLSLPTTHPSVSQAAFIPKQTWNQWVLHLFQRHPQWFVPFFQFQSLCPIPSTTELVHRVFQINLHAQSSSQWSTNDLVQSQDHPKKELLDQSTLLGLGSQPKENHLENEKQSSSTPSTSSISSEHPLSNTTDLGSSETKKTSQEPDSSSQVSKKLKPSTSSSSSLLLWPTWLFTDLHAFFMQPCFSSTFSCPESKYVSSTTSFFVDACILFMDHLYQFQTSSSTFSSSSSLVYLHVALYLLHALPQTTTTQTHHAFWVTHLINHALKYVNYTHGCAMDWTQFTFHYLSDVSAPSISEKEVDSLVWSPSLKETPELWIHRASAITKVHLPLFHALLPRFVQYLKHTPHPTWFPSFIQLYTTHHHQRCSAFLTHPEVLQLLRLCGHPRPFVTNENECPHTGPAVPLDVNLLGLKNATTLYQVWSGGSSYHPHQGHEGPGGCLVGWHPSDACTFMKVLVDVLTLLCEQWTAVFTLSSTSSSSLSSYTSLSSVLTNNLWTFVTYIVCGLSPSSLTSFKKETSFHALHASFLHLLHTYSHVPGILYLHVCLMQVLDIEDGSMTLPLWNNVVSTSFPTKTGSFSAPRTETHDVFSLLSTLVRVTQGQHDLVQTLTDQLLEWVTPLVPSMTTSTTTTSFLDLISWNWSGIPWDLNKDTKSQHVLVWMKLVESFDLFECLILNDTLRTAMATLLFQSSSHYDPSNLDSDPSYSIAKCSYLVFHSSLFYEFTWWQPTFIQFITHRPTLAFHLLSKIPCNYWETFPSSSRSSLTKFFESYLHTYLEHKNMSMDLSLRIENKKTPPSSLGLLLLPSSFAFSRKGWKALLHTLVQQEGSPLVCGASYKEKVSLPDQEKEANLDAVECMDEEQKWLGPLFFKALVGFFQSSAWKEEDEESETFLKTWLRTLFKSFDDNRMLCTSMSTAITTKKKSTMSEKEPLSTLLLRPHPPRTTNQEGWWMGWICVDVIQRFPSLTFDQVKSWLPSPFWWPCFQFNDLTLSTSISDPFPLDSCLSPSFPYFLSQCSLTEFQSHFTMCMNAFQFTSTSWYMWWLNFFSPPTPTSNTLVHATSTLQRDKNLFLKTQVPWMLQTFLESVQTCSSIKDLEICMVWIMHGLQVVCEKIPGLPRRMLARLYTLLLHLLHHPIFVASLSSFPSIPVTSPTSAALPHSNALRKMLPWPYSIFLSLLSLFRRFYLSHTKTLLQSPSMYFLILRHMFTLLGTTVSSTWLPHILPHFTRFFQWLIQTSPPTVFQMHLLQHVLIHVLSLNTPFFNVFQPTLLPFFSLNPSSSFFHTLLSQLPTQQSKDRCKQILTEFEKYHHYRGKV